MAHILLLDILNSHYFQLPKIHDIMEIEDNYETWMYFIKNLGDQDKKIDQLVQSKEVFKMAYEEYSKISADDRIRERVEAHEKYLMDQRTRERIMRERELLLQERERIAREQGLEQGLEQGREQGLEQGLEQGREQGIEQGVNKTKIEMAQKALEKGLSIEDIADLTGLSVEEIMQIGHANT